MHEIEQTVYVDQLLYVDYIRKPLGMGAMHTALGSTQHKL